MGLEDAVGCELSGGVGIVTLRRPEVRNALHPAMARRLGRTFAELGADPALRCVIVRGDGPAFCAGGDIRVLTGQSPADVVAYNHEVVEAVAALEALPVPTIAALGGAALGGGLELALGCTMRVAADDARLGLPEVRGGTIPAAGGLARLPRLVGPGVAARLVLTGEPVDAAEALRIRLVDRVVPRAELDDEVRRTAEGIAAAAPLAVRAATAGLRDDAALPLADAVARGEDRLHALSASDDFREGMVAFVERRAPRYVGR